MSPASDSARRSFIALVSAWAVCSAGARAAELVVVEARASPAHPRLLLAPTSGSEASLHVLFRAGAADDGINYGLTRLSQAALLHGAGEAAYQQLDAALFAAGATLTFKTGVRECSFTLTAPKSRFDALATRLLSLLYAPALTAAGLERARRAVISDPLAAGSAADFDAFVASEVLKTEGVAGGGDYDNPVWGDRDTLATITLPEVKAHLGKKLSPANSVVIGAGAFDAVKLKKAVSRWRGGSERPLRRPDVMKFLPRTVDRWAPREVHLQLQVVEAKTAADVARVHVLSALLHDRMFWRLRRLGFTYGPVVQPMFYEWLDGIVITFQVAPGGTIDQQKVMFDVIDDVAAGTFSDEELARARAVAQARLRALANHTASLAQALEPLSRGVPTLGGDVDAAIAALDKQSLSAEAEDVLGRNHGINFLFGKTRARDKQRGAAEDAP